MEFFNLKAGKYPLMAQIKRNILSTTLKTGDCMYIPSLHYVQSRTHSADTMLLTFTYESASKYVNEFFKAIEGGALDI